MSEWIDVNLPWYKDIGSPKYLPYPDHKEKIKEVFGFSLEDLKSDWSEIPEKDQDRLFFLSKEDLANLALQNDKNALLLLKYRDSLAKVTEWESAQEDNKEIQIKNAEISNYHKEKESKSSFSRSEYCRPGVLIEYKDYRGEIVQDLIGDINAAGGVCDDCRTIDNSTIILRCKVIFNFDKVNCP